MVFLKNIFFHNQKKRIKEKTGGNKSRGDIPSKINGLMKDDSLSQSKMIWAKFSK